MESPNDTYLTYNNLCDNVKKIVTKYWDDYYEIKKSKKNVIEQLKKKIGEMSNPNQQQGGGDNYVSEDDSDNNTLTTKGKRKRKLDLQRQNLQLKRLERKEDDEEDEEKSSDDKEKSPDDEEDEEEDNEEKQRLITELNEKIDDYKKYLFVKYFIDHSQDIKPHFGQGDFSKNSKIIEKLEEFERKIMHIKISNLEKMKLFLCALWDNGYCIDELIDLFQIQKKLNYKSFPVFGIDLLNDLEFHDKQIKSIYNDYRIKNFNHDDNLKKRYSLYIFILHNCIL